MHLLLKLEIPNAQHSGFYSRYKSLVTEASDTVACLR